MFVLFFIVKRFPLISFHTKQLKRSKIHFRRRVEERGNKLQTAIPCCELDMYLNLIQLISLTEHSFDDLFNFNLFHWRCDHEFQALLEQVTDGGFEEVDFAVLNLDDFVDAVAVQTHFVVNRHQHQVGVGCERIQLRTVLSVLETVSFLLHFFSCFQQCIVEIIFIQNIVFWKFK